MSQVVYDTLSHFVDYDDNGYLREGYDGFRIEENSRGDVFVIYKKVEKNEEVERRFVLPDNTLLDFMRLKKEYDYFKEHELLLKMTNDVTELFEVQRDEKGLREVCNEYYEKPSHYLLFVVMNITKSQFYFFVKKRRDNH